MRIDIGPQGQIVGTKRVGAEGQIAGLSDHAGKDVLVLVPDGRASFHFGIQDYLLDLRKTAQRNVKKARAEIKRIEGRLPQWSRLDAARARLESLKPANVQALVEKQVRRVRKDPRVRRFEQELREIRAAPVARVQSLVSAVVPRSRATRSRRARKAA